MTATRDPRASARGLLVRGPMLLPASVAIGALLFLAVKDGGFETIPDLWQIVTLGLLAILVLALLTVPAAGGPPRAVVVATGLLVGYAAWSYLSMTWAEQNADAWDAANRAALYAIVFALFALWPFGRRGLALVTGAIGGAIGVIAVVALLKTAAAADPETIFVNARLGWPLQYPNATVALWFLGFWPCVAIAASRDAHPALRGLFLALAVVLSTTSLLAQSRGWLFAVPIVLVVFVAISPARMRVGWTLIGVGIATLLVGRTVLEVFDRVSAGEPATAEIDSAVRAILIVAVVAGLAGAAAAVLDRRTKVSGTVARRTGRAMVGGIAAVLAVGAIAFVASVGNPASWLDARWEEFKGGPQPTAAAGARFTQTLGSNRYDFWRVAWDGFEERPLTGVGADNFRHPYTRDRRSDEQPLYPHSMVLRTLGQTGLIGTALLFAAIGFAVAAAMQAIRGRRGLSGMAAAGALGSFVYFLVHGAVDWFYEVPGLGALAFALLGVAAGGVPRPALYPSVTRARNPLVSTPAGVAAAAVGIGLLLAALVPPMLAMRDTQRAVDTFNDDPGQAAEALDTLDRAAGRNPFSTLPRQMQGRIAMALGQPQIATRYFEDALERDSQEVYSTLVLAALRSSAGRRAEADRLLRRARALSPRDELSRDLLERVRAGRRIRYVDVTGVYTERREERGR